MPQKGAAGHARHNARNQQVRIIGGTHRRRILHFPAIEGLRPTPDRVRETLFNGLGQDLTGLRCLDLFAGSGALGLEAASRGAAEVVLVESDAGASRALRENIRLLELPQVRVERGDGLSFLRQSSAVFDLIFLDPPFSAGLLDGALREAATHLAPGGRIYAEFGDRLDSEGWLVLRQGRAGQSHSCLLERA